MRSFRDDRPPKSGRLDPCACQGRISALHLDNPARRWHQSGTYSRTGRALMKQFLLKFFTWWNGQTFGT
ncbi:MAG TPA: hypothetical protein VFP38_22085, partial [Bradyrhizobium sp.]|nr:hypothetical protein [Bradyrhizobium sp.]